MTSLEHSKHLVDRFGKDKAIKSLKEAKENWQIKSKAPQIHPIELCKRSIRYFSNCIKHIQS